MKSYAIRRGNWRSLAPVGALLVCGWLVAGVGVAGAEEDSSVLVETPAEAEALPVLPPPAERQVVDRPAVDGRLIVGEEAMPAPAEYVAVEEQMPAPATPEMVVYPVRKLKYDTDGGARRLFGRYEMFDTILIVKNPRDGCFYEVPVCLPVCCVGEPKARPRFGLGGRGIVDFYYDCGLRVKVIFRHRRGDVKVDYKA